MLSRWLWAQEQPPRINSYPKLSQEPLNVITALIGALILMPKGIDIMPHGLTMAHMSTLNKDKGSIETSKASLPLPLPVQRALARLGEDLNRARRRRGLSQKDVAQRIGASVSTIKRIEAGDPKVQFHFIARVLHLFGELQRLTELLDASRDDIGLTLMDSQLPQRIHSVKKSKITRAF